MDIVFTLAFFLYFQVKTSPTNLTFWLWYFLSTQIHVTCQAWFIQPKLLKIVSSKFHIFIKYKDMYEKTQKPHLRGYEVSKTSFKRLWRGKEEEIKVKIIQKKKRKNARNWNSSWYLKCCLLFCFNSQCSMLMKWYNADKRSFPNCHVGIIQKLCNAKRSVIDVCLFQSWLIKE